MCLPGEYIGTGSCWSHVNIKVILYRNVALVVYLGSHLILNILIVFIIKRLIHYRTSGLRHIKYA